MRIIARLDVKNEHVIKGIHLEGLRKIGDPQELAQKYYLDGVDEIFFIDCVASLYNRNNLFSVIRKASENVFVPITVGGGLRSIDDVSEALDCGADKVAVNTAAVRSSTLVSEIARRYGRQCIVASIQTKKSQLGIEAYIDAGRERTGLCALKWARQLEEQGAGELLVTSIDKDGTKSGFDIGVVAAINDSVTIPIVVSGGFGDLNHISQLLKSTTPSGICIGTSLHYNLLSIQQIRQAVESTKEMHEKDCCS
ncbi:MAG: imidazole glycerol phosphate synthase subunit HisF [Chitinophagia bacterium]|nr:imidazole glycerol phosphate synthase subunit HisF [Chitinophagia bacterium]